MPDVDYVAEVQRLRHEERFGEALVVADAGRQVLIGQELARLENEIEATIEYRDSRLRKLKEVGLGAISGEPRSVEAAIGAITADFFIVGDLRDLLIQGTKQIVDGDSDELILALSTVGFVTTVAPPVDVGLSVLKIAKKTGKMTAKMATAIMPIVKNAKREVRALEKIAIDTFDIGKRASFGGATRIISHLDHPHDISRVADFVRRNDDAAFVLHVAGKEGTTFLLRHADDVGEGALRIAARKGDHGLAWLRTSDPARLFRPHPFVGIAKAISSGRLREGFRRYTSDYLDPYGYWVIGAILIWLMAELAMINKNWARSQA
jgi:hypothetical protein